MVPEAKLFLLGSNSSIKLLSLDSPFCRKIILWYFVLKWAVTLAEDNCFYCWIYLIHSFNITFAITIYFAHFHFYRNFSKDIFNICLLILNLQHPFWIYIFSVKVKELTLSRSNVRLNNNSLLLMGYTEEFNYFTKKKKQARGLSFMELFFLRLK